MRLGHDYTEDGDVIKLLSISPRDGWAYAREDSIVYLICPSYAHDRPIRMINEYVVEESVNKAGFYAEDADFDTWNELHGYLSDQIKISRPELLEVSVESSDDLLDELNWWLSFASG